MTAVAAGHVLADDIREVAHELVRWFESGERRSGLFADDVVADLTVPHWRVQATGVDATYGLRERRHPSPGRVRVEALDATSRGFLLQIEERWEDGGEQWYARELIHCAVADGRIRELIVYCTGDWDEERQQLHSQRVRLLRV